MIRFMEKKQIIQVRYKILFQKRIQKNHTQHSKIIEHVQKKKIHKNIFLKFMFLKYMLLTVVLTVYYA